MIFQYKQLIKIMKSKDKASLNKYKFLRMKIKKLYMIIE